MPTTERTPGESRFGSRRGRGTLMIESGNGNASGLVMQDTNGVEYILWFRNDGVLMRGSRANFTTPNTAGTTV